MYTTLATQKTPALIIYLLDVSISMTKQFGFKQRKEVVKDALKAALRQMVFRSTKGGRISPRYRIAILAYSDHVYDLLDGIKPVDQVGPFIDKIEYLGVPDTRMMRTTDTAKAFAKAEKMLERELPYLADCPVPLVCHMTDGEYTADDPEPIVQRILQMSVPDGNILVENIFISENILSEPVMDPKRWPGIMPYTQLQSDYACKLRDMSSIIPDCYRTMMQESNYRLNPGALMLFPGSSQELVALGFQMSSATPVR